MKRKFAVALSSVGGIFVLWVLTIVASGAGWNPFRRSWNFTNTGAFGDSFGPLSAVMAAVAAISALLAWRSQVAESDRLRASEVVTRNDALSDRDEATFFQLVTLFRQIVSGIDIHLQSGKIKQGHDAIAHILGQVSEGNDEATKNSYDHLYNRYKNDLGHYFRLAYNIFVFIERSHLDDKVFYSKIVRALFSDAELALLALNCLYGRGREKFKPLVEKFCLLNNLSDEMIHTFRLKDHFSPAAFERTNRQQ